MMKPLKIRVDVRVALLYAIFGGMWILFSDNILAELVPDHELYMQMQTYKGWFFVAVSAALIFFLLLREINQRKKTDAELLRTEELYRSLFENMIEGFTYCKMVFEHGQPTDWVYLAVNEAFETLTGLKDVTGKRVSEVIPGIRQSDSGLFEIYGRVAETGKAERFEIFLEALQEWFSISVYSPQKEYFVAVFNIITERKQAEEILRASERRFKALIENASDLIVVIDMGGIIQFASPSAIRMMGFYPEETIGKNLLEWVHRDDVALAREALSSLEIADGTRVALKMFGRHKDGSWHVMEVIGANLLDEPAVRGIVLNIRDVTEREQAEEALRRRADELSALQAVILDMTSPRPLNEALETIVERAVTLLGATSGGMYLAEPERRRVRCVVSYKTLSDYTGTVLNYGEGAAGQVAETGQPLMIDDYRTWSGRAAVFNEEQPFQAIVSVPLLSKGQVIGVIHVIRDRKFSREELGLLTLFANHAAVAVDRARLLDSLRENEERYRLLFESAPVGILSVTPQGQILEVNPSALQILGSPSAEATKKINMLTFPPLIEAGISANLQRCFETHQPIAAEHFYTTKWDKPIDVHYQLVPIPDEHGQINQVQCLVEDITERKQAEILQEAVYRISEAAQNVESREELFKEVHAIIGGVMPADNFYIALLDEENNLIRYPYYRDEKDGWNPFPTAPIEKGMTEYVLRTGKSLLCGPALFDELVKRGEVELVGAPSLVWVGVPLTIGARTIGIMAMQDYTNAQAYGVRELRMIEYVSGQVARVIEHQQAKESLREEEERYHGIFENSPISLWEEDFSGVKKRLDSLRQLGITDFRAYFESNPQVVAECAALVRIVDVNQASLTLYHAKGKQDLLKNLTQIFRDESYQQFQAELIYITEGRTHFEWEGINQTLDQTRIDINLSWSVAPGHEEDLSRVIISIVDITARKQAEETILARKKELESLFSLSTRMSTPLREEDILPIVLEEVKKVFETDAGAVVLLDAGGNQFVTALADGALRSTIGFHYNVKDGASGQVFQTGKPILVDNYASFDHKLEDGVETEMLGPSIFAPIQSEGQFLGVLLATRLIGADAASFGDDAMHLLSAMGQMVGNALRRVRLYQQALGRLNHLQGMQNINTVIANSLNLDLSLGVLVKEVRTQMEADAAAAFILEPHSLTLNFVTGDGLRTRALAETRLHLGEACAGVAALEQRLVSIPNESTVIDEICRRIFEREGIVSSYAIPMLAKGKVRGVLQIFNRSPYSLDTEREALLKTLASQAALAVDNIQLFDDLQQSNFRLAMAYDATIEGWSNALDLRDKETKGHTQRVTDLTLNLARAMGIPEHELIHIRRGALLHDIGKMGVPDHILLKPDKLNAEERVLMKMHPVHAYKMLAQIQFLHPALDIPHHHHERWDGSGYPDGLKGERIPLHARLFAVVDVWDALTSDRPYRKAWTRKQALDYIRENSGILFDPQVVDEFLRMIQTDKG